jgi:hypothetical protein
MGLSTVMMWRASLWLISWSSAASVDVLPEPVELLERGLEGGQQADGEAHAACAAQDVDAAPLPRQRQRAVMGAALDELGPAGLANDFLGHGGERFGGDGLAREPELPADPQRHGHSTLEMDVARALLPGQPDDRFEPHVVRGSRKRVDVSRPPAGLRDGLSTCRRISA